MKHSALRNRLEWAATGLTLAVLRLLPWRASLAVASTILRLLDLAVPKLRRAAMRNVEMVFPEMDRASRTRLADACFRSLARLLATLARFPRIHRGNVHEWIRYEGFEHFEQARSLGHGVLFATGHLGNWELSAFAHALMSEPMVVVVRPLDNPLLDRMATRYRSLSGNTIAGRDDFLRPLLRILHANGAAGILADQNTTADRGVFVSFFGIPACVEAGLARLAQRTGAPVIPGFAVWSEPDQRYKLKFYPPLELTGDELEDTQRIQSSLEMAIREFPDQWLWIHRRWKTRPPGEQPLYD